MKNFKLAMIGFGTVGQGLAEILLSKKDQLAEQEGIGFQVTAISDFQKGSVSNPDGVDLARALEVVGGGGSLDYLVDLAGIEGPLAVEVELWYQPIGFRWAHNLADTEAAETERFVGYYDEMAESSAVVMARSTAIVR